MAEKLTRYVVLACVDEGGITWDRIGSADARSQEEATRRFSDERLGDRNPEEVMLVAVPESSFQPRRPRVRTILEDVKLEEIPEVEQPAPLQPAPEPTTPL